MAVVSRRSSTGSFNNNNAKGGSAFRLILVAAAAAAFLWVNMLLSKAYAESEAVEESIRKAVKDATKNSATSTSTGAAPLQIIQKDTASATTASATTSTVAPTGHYVPHKNPNMPPRYIPPIPNYPKYIPPVLDSTTPQRVLLTSLVYGAKMVAKPRFRIFIETCRTAGEHFDFLIIGDTKPPFELPPNVKHYQITWNQTVDRVLSKVFDNDLAGVKPKKMERLYKEEVGYKKCNDYKPLFGYLFPELAQNYDWWGHCDNDMLLGNLEKHVPQSLLRQYDVIHGDTQGGRPKTWGPFTLFRNIPEINTLFLEAPSRSDKGMTLQKLFLDDTHRHFDENGLTGNGGQSAMSATVRGNGVAMGLRVGMVEGTVLWDKTECLMGHMNGPTEERCGECIYYQHNGTVIRSSDQQEVMLCHFQKGKTRQDESFENNTGLIEEMLQNGNFNASMAFGFSSVITTV